VSALLDVEDLSVTFGRGRIAAVRGASLRLEKGETHCLVGESGCGKSVTALALMGLLARGGERRATRMDFAGTDLRSLPDRAMARIRGNRMSMIFQEPMTSLNPAFTVGSQMAEVLTRHKGASRTAALERAIELMGRVGITAPEMRLGQFPHQLSGGLRQRVMIAMALMCDPELLVADEPTTARCHRTGADLAPARAIKARVRPFYSADHPRPRHRGARRRPRFGDVRGRGGRIRSDG
jgi:peptide/nickel transport system ATP-binding protein